MEALKDHEILCYYMKKVPSYGRILQSDISLHYMELKVTSSKPAKWVVINERGKMTTRSAPAGKREKSGGDGGVRAGKPREVAIEEEEANCCCDDSTTTLRQARAHI